MPTKQRFYRCWSTLKDVFSREYLPYLRKGKWTFAEREDEESKLQRLRKYVGQFRHVIRSVPRDSREP